MSGEATDGRRGLDLMIEHGISSSARVAPLIGAINAAASTDPAFADFWDASCSARRNGTAGLVAGLAARDQLRAGLPIQRAADILYAIGSHETLSALLTTCGWPLEDVKGWYYDFAASCCLRRPVLQSAWGQNGRQEGCHSIASLPKWRSAGSDSRAARIYTSCAVVVAPTLDRAFARWCFTVERDRLRR